MVYVLDLAPLYLGITDRSSHSRECVFFESGQQARATVIVKQWVHYHIPVCIQDKFSPMDGRPGISSDVQTIGTGGKVVEVSA